MSFNFKLTQDNGLTRRVGFLEQPDWFALATKIELLFAIPAQNVAVAYIDGDGDEVTLSTPEELDEYLATFFTPGEVIKFAVKDLAALRSKLTTDADAFGGNRTPPVSLLPGNSEGLSYSGDLFEKFTGARGFPDITEEEWQDVHFNTFHPQMFHPSVPVPVGGASTPPHIEIVETSSASRSSKIPSQISEPLFEDARSTKSSAAMKYTTEEKGKGKNSYAASVEDDLSMSSITNAEQTPISPIDTIETTPKQVQPALDESSRPAQSLPGRLDDMNASIEQTTDIPPTANDDTSSRDREEPILSPTPSLVADISTFINDVTQAFASHPELSEGWRNIIRNLGSGQYWINERVQIMDKAKQAASTLSTEGQNLTRSVNAAVAEDEAAKRVTEVIGGIFGALSETLSSFGPIASHAVDVTERAETNAPGPSNPEVAEVFQTQPEQSHGNDADDSPLVVQPHQLAAANHAYLDHPDSHVVSVFPASLHPQAQSQVYHDGVKAPFAAPTTQAVTSFGDGDVSRLLTKMLGELSLDDVRGLMAENNLRGRNTESLTEVEKIALFEAAKARYPEVWSRHTLTTENFFGRLTSVGEQDASALKAHEQALEQRVRLEHAKAKYKEEKELFRAAKEKLRREKEEREKRKATISATAAPILIPKRTLPVPPLEPTAAATPVHIRGQADSYGAVSLATAGTNVNRSNTWSGVPGPGWRHRHRVDQVNSLSTLREAATFRSILQRLDDMGFNETTNTGIRQVVESHISSQGSKAFRMTKEKEDELVTNILDDLINAPPTSGPSGIRNRTGGSMPGEW